MAEPDVDEYTIMNLTMFVQRLARLLRKFDPDSKAATQALDFIERKRLRPDNSFLRDAASERLVCPHCGTDRATANCPDRYNAGGCKWRSTADSATTARGENL